MSDGAPARFGGFLAASVAPAAFDAAAFGLSEGEAALVDPQQRLLLEAFYEAAAGAAAASAGDGRAAQLLPAHSDGGGADCGVYVGISAVDYLRLSTRLGLPITSYSATGGLSLSVAAGRLSFTFGLSGPALAIDTACSSSLVAVHTASAALRLAHCRAAAAGGVNLTLIPDTPAMFQRAGEHPLVWLHQCLAPARLPLIAFRGVFTV
jgi:acyl transferase domain-containing protein